jgi:hypothetical protein
MASDFNKMIYHAVEENVKRQLGDKKLSKQEFRGLMDVVMEHFANSLVAIVASVAEQQMRAKQAAEDGASIVAPEQPAAVPPAGS